MDRPPAAQPGGGASETDRPPRPTDLTLRAGNGGVPPRDAAPSRASSAQRDIHSWMDRADASQERPSESDLPVNAYVSTLPQQPQLPQQQQQVEIEDEMYVQEQQQQQQQQQQWHEQQLRSARRVPVNAFMAYQPPAVPHPCASVPAPGYVPSASQLPMQRSLRMQPQPAALPQRSGSGPLPPPMVHRAEAALMPQQHPLLRGGSGTLPLSQGLTYGSEAMHMAPAMLPRGQAPQQLPLGLPLEVPPGYVTMSPGGSTFCHPAEAEEEPRRPPLEEHWCYVPCALLAIFIGVAAYYLYVRFTTLTSGYAVFIACIEILGISSFVPYAILLTRGVFPTGSPGLKPADPLEIAALNEDELRFNVHVLVPTYKESLEIVAATVNAALEADLPAGSRRIVYLLDDGGSDEKKRFITSLRNPCAKYITGRERKPGQINGKSENLNHALRIIYADHLMEDGSVIWQAIPLRDSVVVFDADMRAKKDFFTKTLEVMADEELMLCLTPQAFHNINAEGDLFNNINKQFWEYWLPGAFAWGYIACTGTNFVIRARALASCGWFPNQTITEDYALGMELKKRGYAATYLMAYVAEGEAPEDIRQVFQQRSRWTKGHYQVFFSSGNPFFLKGLPFAQRLWYCYAAWAPFCNTITMPVFFLVPFVSIVFGYHPVSISFEYVLASTLFFASILSIQFFARSFLDLKLLWYANISNTVLWFTHTKAFTNTLLAKLGIKVMVFKATAKTKKDAEAANLEDGFELLSDVGGPVDKRRSSESTPVLARHRSSNCSPINARFNESGFPSPFKRSKSPAALDLPDSPNDSWGDSLEQSPRKTRGGGVGRFAAGGSSAGADVADAPWTPTRKAADANTEPAPQKRSTLQMLSQTIWPARQLLSRGKDSAQTKGATNAGSCPNTPTDSRRSSPFSDDALHQRDARAKKTVRWTKGDHSEAAPLVGNEKDKPAAARQPSLPQSPRKPSRISQVMASFSPDNVSDWWAVFDPLVQLFLLAFCITTGCLGIWQLAIGNDGSNNNKMAFGSPMSGSPYLIIATLWAWYNCVGPYLFVHYCFSVGPSFRFLAKWLAVASFCAFLGSIICAWMLIPVPVSQEAVLELQSMHYYPSAASYDTNVNFNFVTGLDAIPLQLPVNATVNLTGGLLTSDHVKYGMPLAYSLTNLAWAMIKFPDAFPPHRQAPLLYTLRRGAEYLMRCDLNPGSTSHPIFAAQVGNGADYIVMEDQGFDPVMSNKTWSAPWQDPQLVGDKPRNVWVLTKDSAGADLLSSVTAALAAVSALFQKHDEAFAAQAVLKARQVYRFATMDDKKPRSYCDFVPCEANITYEEEEVVKEMEVAPEGALVSRDVDILEECYYIEWITKTCRIGSSLEECTRVKAKSNDVYANRLDCCNAVFPINMESGNLPQGICAVPEGQWTCYVQDKAQRACFEQHIDNVTGAGCSGRNLAVFESSLACCEDLSKDGVIKPDDNKAGMGLCSLAHIDPAFTKCWVPSVSTKTCEESTGAECEGFGLETSYNTKTACCNRLFDLVLPGVPMGQKVSLAGVCGFQATMQSLNSRRLLQDRSAAEAQAAADRKAERQKLIEEADKREEETKRLKEKKDAKGPGSDATGADYEDYADNVSVVTSNGWKVPDFYRDDLCIDGKCELTKRNKTKTVALYNSTSVLDDMAWGAAWLHVATGDPHYLGQAQRYIERHYREDMDEESMRRERSNYVSNWNNVAWATNVLLAEITDADKYHDRVYTMLRTWIHGDAVDTGPVLPQGSPDDRFDPTYPMFDNYTDEGGRLMIVVPECKPTQFYEVDCFDLVDDDCNGLVDREDPACGLFPVLYSENKMAFTNAPTLPNTANTAFLGMLYAASGRVDEAKTLQLQCWGLGQATYMMGGRQGIRSYVVGYGDKSPKNVQHRGSSCAPRGRRYGTLGGSSTGVEDEPCDWDTGFFPQVPNPNLDVLSGALVWGPSDGTDSYHDERRSDDTRVRLEDNVGFTGLLAGLAEYDVRIESCYLGHGVYQRYFPPADRI